MPVDRLPLPSLKAYTAFSVLLLSCSVYYAVQVTTQPGWKNNVTDTTSTLVDSNSVEEVFLHNYDANAQENQTETNQLLISNVLYFMVEEPLCVWTLINMAYCCLILIGKLIQRLVFGELRVIEQQHIKDKFWNFIFYKFIFIFGVINVQYMDEVIVWCSWFSILGFLHVLVQLCKDRFEYLSFSPTAPKWTHFRLLSLLAGIFGISIVLFIICILVGFHTGINVFAFMVAECMLVNIRTLYVIVRYVIHLWDINHQGVWENRGTYAYYAELVFEMTALFIDFGHHIHMLLWGNVFLSMASLVICMQIRYMFYEIQRRYIKHKNYLRVIHQMEENYPMGTAEELTTNSDDCAICWDKMDSARKLPCGHLFHNSCLRSWLEQDTSCPTCRTSLSSHHTERIPDEVRGPIINPNNLLPTNPPAPPATRPTRATTNHFFHFDGSRYVSWLPSFSVEVTHTQLLLNQRQHPVETSQLDNMTHQVHQMFPAMPIHMIREDLQITRSMEGTIENILEERIVVPQFQMPSGSLNTTQTNTLSSQHRADEAATELGANEMLPAANESLSNPSVENDQEEPQITTGCRFSKAPKEREKMLLSRKDELVRNAKRRYLNKFAFGNSKSSEIEPNKSYFGHSSRDENVQEDKRHLAYQAAQRRLHQQSDENFSSD